MKRILVAPLNWGLGHATRCIPIIDALVNHGFEPIIASDGMALQLLKKEFPELVCCELPSYNITYPKQGKYFKLKLIRNAFAHLKAIKAERLETEQIITKFNIDGIISDNRLGVISKKVPSVYITHQLHVLSGNTSWLSTKIHQLFIKKYDACWIPDLKDDPNLGGRLSHLNNTILPTTYLGGLSRLSPKDVPVQNDLLVLLSGPEPQRTMLEKKLLNELKDFNGRAVVVQGLVNGIPKKETKRNLTVVNYLTSHQLEHTINSSRLVLCRSGYSSILDLAKLKKSAFFIPTPGQYEQNYLAERLDKMGIAPYCRQDEFTLKHLEKIGDYRGFEGFKNYTIDYSHLFRLF